MPFVCEWRIPGRVLYAQVEAELTIEDIAVFTRIPVEMIVEEGVPPVYFLVDLRLLRHAPLNLSHLRRVIGDAQSEQIGCYIIIVRNPIFAFIGAALIKLIHRPVRTVTNDEEALACLEELEPGLTARMPY